MLLPSVLAAQLPRALRSIRVLAWKMGQCFWWRHSEVQGETEPRVAAGVTAGNVQAGCWGAGLSRSLPMHAWTSHLLGAISCFSTQLFKKPLPADWLTPSQISTTSCGASPKTTPHTSHLAPPISGPCPCTGILPNLPRVLRPAASIRLPYCCQELPAQARGSPIGVLACPGSTVPRIGLLHCLVSTGHLGGQASLAEPISMIQARGNS